MKKIQKRLDLKRTTVTKLNNAENGQIVGGSDYWIECIANETAGAVSGAVSGLTGAVATGVTLNPMANGGSGNLEPVCSVGCPPPVYPGSGPGFFMGGNNTVGGNPYGNSNPCCQSFDCK